MAIIDIMPWMHIDDIIFVYHLEDEGLMSWHGRLHSHPKSKYEFTYFISGEGAFRSGPVRFSLNPGELFLTKPEEKHQLIPSGKRRPITYYALLFDTEGEKELEALLEEGSDRPRHIGMSYRFFFADLIEKINSGRERFVTAARYQFTAFIYSLEDGQPAGSSSADNVHVEKALAFMHNSIEKAVDLTAICSRLGISREYFVRLFTERMGTPPMKYYVRLKIEAARAMLASTNFRISEISDKLGFIDQFAFSRSFKRESGFSPSQYRSHCLQKAEFLLR
jgi:AraC-like DNA-binding protein/mannose-6-phosphate isomerase-like protein (cupin superfamily)